MHNWVGTVGRQLIIKLYLPYPLMRTTIKVKSNTYIVETKPQSHKHNHRLAWQDTSRNKKTKKKPHISNYTVSIHPLRRCVADRFSMLYGH